DGEVDEDDREPALRRVLPLRRSQAALLERPAPARRAREGDGAVLRVKETRRRGDAVVAVALRLANRAPLDEVNQEQHDRDNQQDVQQTAKRVAGHEAEEPENQQQENEEQHGCPSLQSSTGT